MRATLKFGDKTVVHDNVNSLFFSFSETHLLIHKDGETFPIDKTLLKSVKVEAINLKKEEVDASNKIE